MSLKQLLQDPAYQSLSVKERKILLKKLQAEYEEALVRQATETAARWQERAKKIAIGAAVGVVIFAGIQWFLSRKKKRKYTALPSASPAAQTPLYLHTSKKKNAWHYLWDYLQKEAAHLLAHELSKQIRKFAEQTINAQAHGHSASENTDAPAARTEGTGSTH
jgi:hypothetical protein